MNGGAWPFLVGEVTCLVDSVNERDLHLPNSPQSLKKSKIFYFKKFAFFGKDTIFTLKTGIFLFFLYSFI